MVKADSLRAAVTLLQEQQELAAEKGRALRHAAITTLNGHDLNEIRQLDPQEVVASDAGVTLIDEDGNRVRDLVGVPTGCAQLGEWIE